MENQNLRKSKRSAYIIYDIHGLLWHKNRKMSLKDFNQNQEYHSPSFKNHATL